MTALSRLRRRIGIGALCAIALGGAALSGTLPATPSIAAPAAAPGDSRAEAIAVGQPAEAGPWRLTVREVLIGQAATDLVTAASPVNDPPRDGATYVAVRLNAQNTGDRALTIAADDFAFTGGSGLVRRFVGVELPEPPLTGEVAAGQSREGWVIGGADATETGLRLLFDSLTLPGVWADTVLALQDGDAPSVAPALTSNEIGRDPASPAGLNQPVVTKEWSVELLEVARGAAVYDLGDYRTQALGPEDATNETEWIALRLRVTAGGRESVQPAFLPPGAFQLIGDDGAPLPDTPTLSPPSPDISGAYYPGTNREGWVSFELPIGYAVNAVRFLPYLASDDPRFLTF